MGAPDVENRTDRLDAHTMRIGARAEVGVRGVITGWSREAEQLLGYPAEWVLGRPATEFLATTVESTDADGAMSVVRHRDGRPVPCRLTIRPVESTGTGSGADARWTVTLVPTGPPESDLDRALLEALFTRSPVGLFVLDPQLRLVRFSSAAEGMHGAPAAGALGKRPTEAWPDFSPELVERVLTRVLDTGEPVMGFEKQGKPPGDPDHTHVYSVSAFRLEDDDGRVLGVADAAVDVTERYLAQERLALLAEGGSRIGTGLDVMRTAQELAEVAVPKLADSIGVEVLEPVLMGEEISSGPVQSGAVLRRAASRSRRPGTLPGAYPVGESSTFPPTSPSSQALSDLQPRLISPLTPDSDWVRSDPVRGRRMLEEKIHSLMFVPLVAQDRALGIATFYRWGEQGPFQQDDLTVATELGRRTAVCLDNARRYLREHDSLMALQRSLLPTGPPRNNGVEVAYEYVHGGAGGDWVDVVPLSGARVALVAGSVPGRGMEAAAAMGRLRAAVHTLSDLDLEPDEMLARLDDLVRRLADDAGPRRDGNEPAHEAGSEAPHADSGAWCTFLYLVYDPISLHCCAAGAGHPGPAVVHPDGTAMMLDVPPAAPLGLPGPPFAKTDVMLPEGSVLALHTSGLLRARGGDPEEARLADLLARPSGSVQETACMITEALVPEQAGQDAAVLVARTHALDPGRVASWDLPTDPAVVSTARSLVTRQLTSWNLREEAFATELIASELVTNAMRHAEAPIRLRLIHDLVLTCEVFDGSSTAPRLRHARTTDEGGRGLFLVAQCSDRWGTRYTQRGKTIWTEQKLVHEAGEPA